MLPKPLAELALKLQYFPGVGVRSSQKLALDLLELEKTKYDELLTALSSVREQVKFCAECGFFTDAEAPKGLCTICQNPRRNPRQICLVEKPTDVLTVEKSEVFNGRYHVLENLIAPLENVFAEHTTLSRLVTRMEELLAQPQISSLELILFFKAGFSADATTAYLQEMLREQNLESRVTLTRLAQGLPMYYNPDTLDQATMVRALEDRRPV